MVTMGRAPPPRSPRYGTPVITSFAPLYAVHRPEAVMRITNGPRPVQEPVPPFDPLAFWLYPDWLGDSRDNPRDPGFVPFWMRDPLPPRGSR